MHQEQAVFSRVAFRDIHCFAAQEPAGTRSAAERRPIQALCFSPVLRRTMAGKSTVQACKGLLAPLHGNAVGAEPTEAANPVARAAGYLVATTLLHPLGVGIGCIANWPMGVTVRASGAVNAPAVAAFLTNGPSRPTPT